MKAYKKIFIAVLVITVFLTAFYGCKYDVSEPSWEGSHTTPPTPKITQVNPVLEAKPGVNTITISGENLIVGSDTSLVYFDNTPADIISMSAASITVRRPNLALDSCTIKVIPNKALLVAKHGPYKIDPVSAAYGSFMDDLALGAVAVDNAENLYVVETTSKTVHKVTPTGDKSILGTATRSVTDASIGPDGNLYLMENNRAMDKVDLATGVIARWTQMPSGKAIVYGDFDNNGYFFCGGNKTDLCIIPPNPPASLTKSDFQLSGFYNAQEILTVHVSNGFVYVASRTSTQPTTIWRHSIGAEGNIGTQEQVLDMSTTGDFASRLIKGIEFSSNGTMYIATDSLNPILVVDQSSQVDVFYKGILRPYCKKFCWGNSNFLYMISGDDTADEEWTIYRVDMGE